MDEADKLLCVGDVVQVDPEHDPIFGSCLLIVTELKAWGVMGTVRVPQPGGAADAWYRIPFGKFARVGQAAWVPK